MAYVVGGGEVGSIGIPGPHPCHDDARQTSEKLVRPRGRPAKHVERQGEEIVDGLVQGGIRILLLTLSKASGADRYESVRGVVQAACGGLEVYVGPNAHT
jgi:hypothetical protein